MRLPSPGSFFTLSRSSLPSFSYGCRALLFASAVIVIARQQAVCAASNPIGYQSQPLPYCELQLLEVMQWSELQSPERFRVAAMIDRIGIDGPVAATEGADGPGHVKGGGDDDPVLLRAGCTAPDQGLAVDHIFPGVARLALEQ